ncbi:MAG: electron transfer flavoprotein subunit alpha/FixB family protein [Chitinophagaceae bacterium]|nr:electron transfer flavoprotein subunit alpha/FixB family protein [Chitinophagaceae bacterium]MCW5928874.1 electron transfer flavoprotein subunit alpha/FixB family protein [Chitinophagaceae bacterium]
MSVLIFIDHSDGQVKKGALEALSYGTQLAARLGVAAEGVLLGALPDAGQLGKYGVTKIHQVDNDALHHLDGQVFTAVIAQVVEATGAKVIVFSNNSDGKAIAPRLSARLKAAFVSGAIALPDTANGFVVKKSVFSGKAFANVSLNTEVKIIGLNPNSFAVTASGSGTAEVISFNATVDASKVKVLSTNKIKDEVPLGEAEIVVSGGRGLKGPENWGMIEELAKLLGAATACSRPVSDTHWRPHHEHVGQTGLAIAPNLYIAIGISGAIQHLAGVNRSKTIVVINKDPEAPFFKAADYGIVGDAFEVVPKVIEEVKKLKGVA